MSAKNPFKISSPFKDSDLKPQKSSGYTGLKASALAGSVADNSYEARKQKGKVALSAWLTQDSNDKLKELVKRLNAKDVTEALAKIIDDAYNTMG